MNVIVIFLAVLSGILVLELTVMLAGMIIETYSWWKEKRKK